MLGNAGGRANPGGTLADVMFRSTVTTLNRGEAGSGRAQAPLSGKSLAVHDENSAFERLQTKSFGHISSALMKEMPPEVREQVMRYAAAKLSVLWLPRVLLSSKQKQRKLGVKDEDHKLSTLIAVLKSGELMSCWPEDRLSDLAEGAVPVATQKGDRIITEGESCRSGLWLILSGKGYMTKKMKSKERDQPPSEVIVFRFVAPMLIGDFALLTDEPRTASVILDSECSCFVLQRSVFLKELGLLTKKQQEQIYNKAFQRRQKNIANFFPRTPADIRASQLLSSISDHDAETLLQSLVPLCVRQGMPIVREGERAKCVYYLCRGKAESRTPGSGEVVSYTPSHNAIFGEMGLVFDECRNECTIEAQQHCDLWLLPFTAIRDMMRSASFQERVYSHAAAMRRTHLRKRQHLPDRIQGCAEMLGRTSIIGEICSSAFLRDVATAMKPEAFLPRTTIVSAVDRCEKLIVLVCGKAVVLNQLAKKPTHLLPGDVMGTSLVAVHRWLFPVQALTGCDVWSIDKPQVISLLVEHDHYDAYVSLVRRNFTEFQCTPLGVLLARGRTPCGRFNTPPLLHPCPGLPAGVLAPFHFESKPQYKRVRHAVCADDGLGSPGGGGGSGGGALGDETSLAAAAGGGGEGPEDVDGGGLGGAGGGGGAAGGGGSGSGGGGEATTATPAAERASPTRKNSLQPHPPSPGAQGGGGKSGRGSKRRGRGGGGGGGGGGASPDGEEEEGSDGEGPPKVSRAPVVVTPPEARKFWMVLKPTLPRSEKPGKDDAREPPHPPTHPPREKREMHDSSDLLSALNDIVLPQATAQETARKRYKRTSSAY